MRTVKFSILALSLALTPGVAQAGAESAMPHHVGGIKMGGMPKMGGIPKMGGMPRMGGKPHHGGGHNMGGKPHHGGMDRHAGYRMGGKFRGDHMRGYRRPFRGYALPSYWIQPSFYIPNFTSYGFAQPSYGYGWSRYYNDAVLTDRYGRVYDSVYDVDWDGNGRNGGGDYEDAGYGEDYRDSYGYRDGRRNRRGRGDSGVGGAIAGGAVGAVAGSIIGGRGERLAGGLIGGGLGALAGAAIGSASDRNRDDRRDRRGREVYRDRDYDDGRNGRVASGNGRYDGRWTGAWEGSYENENGQVYNGTYEGTYETEDAREAPVAASQAGPHWGGRESGTYTGGIKPGSSVAYEGSYPAPQLMYHGGHQWGQPQVTTITIHPQPVTTTTTTTYIEEEVVYAKQRKRVYRPKARAYKPKPRCVCKVVYR